MDSVNIHRIYVETTTRLDTLRRRVNEGRDVMAASEFARWLYFSGILTLLEEHAVDGFFKVDGSLLRSKTDHLISLCNDRFRTNNENPSFETAELKSLHDKIDCMAGYLSRLSVAPAAVPSEKISGEDEDRADDYSGITSSLERATTNCTEHKKRVSAMEPLLRS